MPEEKNERQTLQADSIGTHGLNLLCLFPAVPVFWACESNANLVPWSVPARRVMDGFSRVPPSIERVFGLGECCV